MGGNVNTIGETSKLVSGENSNVIKEKMGRCSSSSIWNYCVLSFGRLLEAIMPWYENVSLSLHVITLIIEQLCFQIV